MEKRLYIVRHGETMANMRDAVQDGTDPLSPDGELQALRVGERFKDISFDALIASNYLRAQQTAKAISDATGMPVETSSHFYEVRHPTAFVGMERKEEEFKTYIKEQYAHMGDPAWHFADEENFFDLRDRARKAEAEVLQHEKETLVVVSHANFIKCFVSQLIFGEQFTPEIFHILRPRILHSNTGITIFKYTDDRWHLISWNDHAHLG